jgi:ribosome-associated toxin RatA of RatAB toxin-antitoxin module
MPERPCAGYPAFRRGTKQAPQGVVLSGLSSKGSDRLKRTMPKLDTVDFLEIDAPAEALFAIILDYPRMREWYPRYVIDVIGEGPVQEGSRLRHELAAPGAPIKSRFTRTIVTLDPGRSIEETYDDGDLIGRGRWEFEPITESRTRVSFYCQVRSNRMLMHLGFLLGGERGHNMVYQEILAALQAHVSRKAA